LNWVIDQFSLWVAISLFMKEREVWEATLSKTLSIVPFEVYQNFIGPILSQGDNYGQNEVRWVLDGSLMKNEDLVCDILIQSASVLKELNLRPF